MSLIELMLAIIAYWLLALATWIVRVRVSGWRELRRALAESAQGHQESLHVQVQGEVKIRNLALIAFAPPAFAVAIWIVA